MGTTGETVVECYSGHTYAQEPRTFQLGNARRTVAMVHRRWREPTGPSFDVLADDGHSYVLAYNETTDRWCVLAKANGREVSSGADLEQTTMYKEAGR
jgi:hypothetical protein